MQDNFVTRAGENRSLDDTDLEFLEDLFLEDLDLSESASDYGLEVLTGSQGTLTDLEDSPLSLSIKPGAQTPSETGSVAGTFIVTLSAPAPKGGVIVDYTIKQGRGEALAGVDYQPLKKYVVIDEGETAATIEIVPIDDREKEMAERVTVTISPPSGYTILEGKETAYLAIADDESNPILANILNEPNFKDQWHLLNTSDNRGTPGMDLNVLKAWQDYSGKGVKVGVIDDGIEGTHPDLVDNYDPLPNPPEPDEVIDSHGTAVAGIIAAKAGNGLGGVGVAHNASLTSYNIFTPDIGLLELTEILRAQKSMDVSNNSWGFIAPFFDNFSVAETAAMGRAVQEVATEGRNGLGTVYVFAAGNDQRQAKTSNYNNLSNSRYTISVAALTADGEQTSYSNQGADLLVSAFGSEGRNVFTTDRTGEPGYAPGDYTFGFSGTSAAAPMVSGVVALMLEANSQLGYRDVQEILAYSACWNDADNVSWHVNSAHDWNGGGLHYSQDYGFGLVDALSAVRLAETWQTQHTAANEQRVGATAAPALAIPDANLGGVTDTITIDSGLKLDHVEVELELNHERYADLIVTLTSPTGVVSELVNQARFYDTGGVDSQNFKFTFSSTSDWGESGVGDWKLNVVDARSGKSGTLNNWSLNLYGDKLTANNTYVYTNEFAHAKLKDASRQVLNDNNGGNDILNAAAVTSDVNLDLRRGTKANTIAGRRLALGVNTLIETAFGGDGNDQLKGNRADNALHGGRGNDVLKGRLGNDTLQGDAGDDRLIGGLGDDQLTGGEGRDVFSLAANSGLDTIHDFMVGVDVIGLSGGLQLGQLSMRQEQKDTLISLENQALAVVKNVFVEQLTASSFMWA